MPHFILNGEILRQCCVIGRNNISSAFSGASQSVMRSKRRLSLKRNSRARKSHCFYLLLSVALLKTCDSQVIAREKDNNNNNNNKTCTHLTKCGGKQTAKDGRECEAEPLN